MYKLSVKGWNELYATFFFTFWVHKTDKPRVNEARGGVVRPREVLGGVEGWPSAARATSGSRHPGLTAPCSNRTPPALCTL